ncbi:MAG: flagellar export protein FliJ [Phycisphaerae bacterium]|nr:flagellar export protein FliJ [Phycisphaerae bacterium]
MKRFVWRLQRILEIETKKEQKVRSELLDLTEKLAETRGVLLTQQMILKDIMAGLAGESPKKRLSRQEFFLRYSGTSDERIEKLKENVSALESQQREKIAELLKVRRFKEGLERLRAEAKTQFIKEQEKLEQKELDEMASVSFVRNMILAE